ncbi:MAG: S-layer homology domain-containing protein [Polyangiaceae bacterium]|nr:S-layer homology domain-containing protein [Polyangiaceae bacterium]
MKAEPRRWVGWFLGLATLVGTAPLIASCAATSEPEEELEEEVAETDRGDGVSAGTVLDASKASCTTASVKGLSAQIIAEANCVNPDAFVAVPALSNLSAPANVFLNLEKPARDKLVAALKAYPNTKMTINSALRTVAQQYLLYRWYQTGSCGISLAAKPGNSNHETGLALDVDNYSTWKSKLSAHGFSWLGGNDPVHFDYTGAGAKDLRGLDVLAFQRLWNRNNPNDKISEDGDWGPNTEARMKKAPAAGFAKGATCECDAVFKDICSSPFRKDIEWMAAEGLTTGCDPQKGLYCPEAPVSRGQMAAFLTAVMELPAGPDAFTDDNGSAFESAINSVAKAGIAAGCQADPPKFCPDQSVTRGQMAVFLAKALNLPAGADAFVDDDGSPYEAAINAVAKAGITSGCDAKQKLYCPDQVVSRGQIAAFLHTAFGTQ